jgi:hypothetical protein
MLLPGAGGGRCCLEVRLGSVAEGLQYKPGIFNGTVGVRKAATCVGARLHDCMAE